MSPPVRWSGVPSGTVELMMFFVRLRPVNGRVFFDWAVANISPAAHGISVGALPSGAIVGRDSFGDVGYSICPPKGTGEEHFILRLVALRSRLGAKPGFDAEALYQAAERSATAVGIGGGNLIRP